MEKDAKGRLAFKDDEIYDQSHRAEAVLDYVLRGENAATQSASNEIDIRAERAARGILETDTGRTASRVLFVTADASVLAENSATQNEYRALANHFDEVHVMVLASGKAGEKPSVRFHERGFAYPVYAAHWWQLPFKARTAATEALVFNGVVRPDVIVGIDPFEAGYGAYLIAKEFARPLQVHVLTDFFDPEFLKRAKQNGWRRRLARHVLKRTKSVRAKTSTLKEMIAKRFKGISDLTVLPKFHNFAGYRDAVPSYDIHDTYKDFVFIALVWSPLRADSALHDVFTALHHALKNPRIGMVVIGDGPAKSLFEEKARLLGIERNVVFLKEFRDPVSAMKTADLLIEVDTSVESEEHVLRAIASGLPVLAVQTDLRNDLLTDGQSAYLCPPGDTACLTQKFSKFLNGPSIRKQFARTGIEIARDRLIEDPDSYHRAYRDTIEVIIETVEPAPAESKEPTEKKPQAVTNGARAVAEDGMSYPATAIAPQEQKT